MKRFPEKRAFITGSGSGLGRALAEKFAREGWSVGVSDIDRTRVDETAHAVEAAGGRALAVPCDVTKPEELARAAGAVRRAWRGLDVLVNNAGVAAGGYFEAIPLDRWEWIINVNFMSVVHGCRAFIPMMKEQGRGHIANNASCAGIASLPEMASYNASKAAVISLSETLRSELAPCGIGVTVLCPTFIRTNLMESFDSPDERQRRLAERFFSASTFTPGQFAENAFRAIAGNRLYAFPQRDGRAAWRLKRWFPELYHRAIARYYAGKVRPPDATKRRPAPGR